MRCFVKSHDRTVVNASDRIFAAAVAILLATMAVLQITSVLQESQTYDEAVYISAGYAYWRTGDFRLNTEHPPLAKLLVAAPLLAMNLDLPLADPSWTNADEYGFGARFLYRNRLPADAILFAARCVTIATTILFGLILALWTRRRGGPLAAILALTLFAFDPNILAHGRYATNDLYLAFFFFIAVVLWNRALERGGSAGYALAGLALGLAVCTKLSAVLLLPAFALLCLTRRPNPAALARGSALAAAAAVAVIAVLYHGQLYHYRDAIADSLQHARGGQLAYLFGETFKIGRWYFYPAVAAVKTPLGVFLLVGVTLIALATRRRLALDSDVMLLPAVAYAMACIASPIDLGIRVLLPVYPLLYVFVALNLPLKKWRWAVAACVAIVLAESAAIYPDYLAFFNTAAGGPTQGPRYLLDSNIDWGQDTKRLRDYLQARNVRGACTAYFGMAYPFYYGIVQLPWVGYVTPANRSKLNCIVAVSVTWLYGGPAIAGPTWGWLRSQTPNARIGYSIYLYDFRRR
jgi:hypothetical protein